MKKILIYIYSAIISIVVSGCADEFLQEPDFMNDHMIVSDEIVPSACISDPLTPVPATKALVNTFINTEFKGNFIRLDEIVEDGSGTGRYADWTDAYLMESTVMTPSSDNLRSVYLNPVQAYKYLVSNNASDTAFYRTKMVGWYPQTCVLHKDSEGKAAVTKFSDYQKVNSSVYDYSEGELKLNFHNLDGQTDIMVTNVVEGQHWQARPNSTNSNYRFPYGHSYSIPLYTNNFTYRHYLSAVKVYVYTDGSEQVTSMWGNIMDVLVKDQPTSASITLSDRSSFEKINEYVQYNDAEQLFDIEFTGNTDYNLVKTSMYGNTGDIAEEQISLDGANGVENRKYLGYALIKPNIESQSNQTLDLEFLAESGMMAISVPMNYEVTTVTESGESTTSNVDLFKPGFIYEVNVCFNTDGAIADVVFQSASDSYFDLTSMTTLGTNMSEQGEEVFKHANCYMIYPGIGSTSGSVLYDGFAFDATTVGNGDPGLYDDFDRTTTKIDPIRAGLLWESVPGLITQVELLYGYVRFKVKKTNNNYTEGNAVIAVYDSMRQVLWSWHIWITDKPQDVTSGDIVYMDRNLGATAADPSQITTIDTDDGDLLETYGLYYQWGRKDPSMGPPQSDYKPQSTATSLYYDYYGSEFNYAGVVTLPEPEILDGIQKPMYLILPSDFSMPGYKYDWLYKSQDDLWGQYDLNRTQYQKSIYDPCPYGYMVPQDEITTLFSGEPDLVENMGYKVNGHVENNAYGLFFPFAGYKGVDKGASSMTASWRYVGQKGDYMSSKIDMNGHRSRTYISSATSWTEYGADSDGDGNGDEQRNYTTSIYSDDMANRRTAASVRCIKSESALNSSLLVSFTAGRTYFWSDESIDFNYDIYALGSNNTIEKSRVERDGTEHYFTIEKDNDDTDEHWNGTIRLSHEGSSGHFPGLHGFRIVTETRKVKSRVSYGLNILSISNIKIGNTDYTSDFNASYGTKYTITFDVTGKDDGYIMYLNDVQASCTKTYTPENTTYNSVIKSYTADVYIYGSLNFYVHDSGDQPVVNKEFSVKMTEDKFTNEENPVSAANDLVDGLYIIQCVNDPDLWWAIEPADSGNKLTLTDNPDTQFDAKFVFEFKRDDTKAGEPNGYKSKSAGTWKSIASGEYLNKDFSVGEKQDAVYITSANKWGNDTGSDIDMYRGKTNETLKWNGSSLIWTTDMTNSFRKWYIYKAVPATNQ